ncbi:MAG TPA: DUF1127 domain-containing protein [Acetobacteraceae bacterium]|jgi:uncharacterized protein YjiS (DUF1127 family)
MSATIHVLPFTRGRASLAARLQMAMTRIRRRWHEAQRVVASRRNLARLDSRMLSDLGISQAQAQFEASRAPWQLDR